ncbi:MAG: hypothetical protein ACJARG_000161, partial [Arcticibacterium sp.]
MIYVSSRTASMESRGYGKSNIMTEDFIKTHCKDRL